MTIPPGSFSQLTRGSKAGSGVFAGSINGVTLAVQIVPLGGASCQFKVTAPPVDLTSLSNPVTLTITIANNTGTTSLTASLQ